MADDRLSPWALNISPSPTLAVDAKAKALKAEGKDVCSFGSGEPDFDTPDFIKNACARALAAGETKYCPAAGLPELREAIAARYEHERGVKAAPEQVVVSPGGKFSCYLSLLATCGPGDEVIIPAPYWVSYPEMVKLTGATPRTVFAGAERGFKIDAVQLEEAITARTRLLILNSPSNPTGAVYTGQELRSLVDVALKHKLLILSDEIYEYLLYDEASHVSPASFREEAAESVMTASGFSKTYSMTGWRLGTLVAPKAVAKAVASLQSQTSSNATTFAQHGALAALRETGKASEALERMRGIFDGRRRKLLDGLNAIEGIQCERAAGAFYLFPRIADMGLDSAGFAERLLEEELVAVVPGVAFGADGHVRVSYATSDAVIKRGLERIERFCRKH